MEQLLQQLMQQNQMLMQQNETLISIIRNLEEKINNLETQTAKTNLLVTTSSPLASMEEQRAAAMQLVQMKEREHARAELESQFIK